MAWIILEISFFRLVPPSSAWSVGSISWYGVYGSPAICRWRELIISRILGRNWQPTVPGVHYPDRAARGGAGGSVTARSLGAALTGRSLGAVMVGGPHKHSHLRKPQSPASSNPPFYPRVCFFISHLATLITKFAHRQ
jgi:hypothetical protein